jgi:hypothetical protein
MFADSVGPSRIPNIIGYNLTLGAFDTGAGFDSQPAILSVCGSQVLSRTLRFQDDGNLAIFGGNTKLWQTSTQVSDMRLKHKLSAIENALEIIRQLSGYRFKYTFDSAKIEAGCSLQELSSVFPEATKDRLVHLEKLVPVLIQAVKSLNSRLTTVLLRQSSVHQSL